MTLQRKTPMKRTPMKRKTNGNSVPKSVRDAVSARSGGRCEAKLPGCTEKTAGQHHRKLRRHPGTHIEENLVDLCDHCHKGVIHANPFWAYHHGWLVRSTADPTVIVPILGCDLDCVIDHYA